MVRYKALLVAPDGDWVEDCWGESVDEVWKKVNELGSRWFFYPLRFVIRDKGKVGEYQRIVSACDGYEFLEGLSVKTALGMVKKIHGY